MSAAVEDEWQPPYLGGDRRRTQGTRLGALAALLALAALFTTCAVSQWMLTRPPPGTIDLRYRSLTAARPEPGIVVRVSGRTEDEVVQTRRVGALVEIEGGPGDRHDVRSVRPADVVEVELDPGKYEVRVIAQGYRCNEAEIEVRPDSWILVTAMCFS